MKKKKQKPTHTFRRQTKKNGTKWNNSERYVVNLRTIGDDDDPEVQQ